MIILAVVARLGLKSLRLCAFASLRLCVRFFTYHLKGDFALPMVAPRSLPLNF